MIYVIGVDLIEIDRNKHAIERNVQRFVYRVYTKAEQ
jgi:phosphopantetheinyl transferase (holo-ACP synthase)